MKNALVFALIALLVFTCSCSSSESIATDTNQSSESVTSDSVPEDEEKEPEEIVLPESFKLQFDNPLPGIYNYCPSIMQTSDDTRYIYYCTNSKSYNVTDYVACRKATRDESGEWKWSEESIVLSPTKNTWDARHVCDPSVVCGSFKYNGETYSYLMAYLGCTSSDNQENKIGLAVAKTPEGPFIKVGTEPFVDFQKDPSSKAFQWGVGQPSLVNMDKKGTVMMFYTRGDKTATHTIAEEWDLSDLSSPKRNSSVRLSETGLNNLNGVQDIINNADFVYDSDAKRFYASSDCHPNPASAPNFISSHFRIGYFSEPTSYEYFVWRKLCEVGPSDTGFPRNHNTGILRDEYGHLPNGYISVYFAVSVEGNNSLWSYRI